MILILEIFLYGIPILFFIVLVIYKVIPLIKGAPYVVTPDKTALEMIKMLKVKPGEKVADLGSGNGKLVIELARRGAQAHGFEIDPILVWRSRRKIKKLGLEEKAFIHWKNLWSVDYSPYSSITIYGIPYIMKDLEKKLKGELKTGSKVVSNYFTFPNWKPKSRKHGVVLYIKLPGLGV